MKRFLLRSLHIKKIIVINRNSRKGKFSFNKSVVEFILSFSAINLICQTEA